MIRLAKPLIPENAIRKVTEILRSGNLVQGKYVEKFEKSLQKYLDIKNAIVVSSGTAALHLSLLALNIKEGDEVIVPAFTFPATANVVELAQAKPVFVDITLDDYCIDTKKIEEVITESTKAIIPVHEFGQSAKMDDIIKIAKQYNLYVIEDAACALGAEFKNKKVGTFGHLGCFSFHPRKTITTGEGGAVITNDDNLAEKIRALRNHGISIKKRKIDFVYAGYNYRMTDFQAVLGFYQIKKINDAIKCRIDLAHEYQKKLKSIEWIKTPLVLKERKAVYQSYHILIDERLNRDDLIKGLKEKGIETNLGAHALPYLCYYKEKYELKKVVFINAFISYRQGLALPMSNDLSKEDISFICDKLWGINK